MSAVQQGPEVAEEEQQATRAVAGGRPDAAVVRDALAVGLAVGVSGVAFGVTGAAAHLTVWQICALSLLVFTGASQFALVGSLAAGAAPAAAIAGALFLGVRNAFYGLRLGERLQLPGWLRPLAAQAVIDETAAVALVQPDRRSTRLGFTVTGVSLYLVWNATTLAGALGANALGDPSRYGLDVAGPAVFLALLAPRLREGGEERAVALLGALLALAAVPLLPAGVPVLVALAAVPVVALCRARRRPRTAASPAVGGPVAGTGATRATGETAAAGPARPAEPTGDPTRPAAPAAPPAPADPAGSAGPADPKENRR